MSEDQQQESPAGKWISYRPEIKVLDCTIRDGGLMNDHKFSDACVEAVYQACVEASIDYMEIGYINSRSQFPPGENGPWKHCVEEDLRRIVGDNDTAVKLSAMADAEKSDYKEDILPKSESVLDMIRVATYIHQMPLALDMVKDAHDKGYETSLNLMALSTVPERELHEALALVAQSEAEAVCIVDSFGALYSEQIDHFLDIFFRYAKEGGQEVGMHAHNNRQLAFANTIQATVRGANRLDASFAGLGRGAGNCPMELLLSFLHNPKFRLRPVLDCIQHHIEPMREELKWGFDYPYMMTGVLNQHPRTGMAFNESADRGDIVKFYDSLETDD
ncbi:MAG: nucleoid-structuring protein H-NS [Candidatus Latescibacteria bacterium]|nr:nucleoid-structuring protein H-NS [Candidatus Latescibacterota bacterium]